MSITISSPNLDATQLQLTQRAKATRLKVLESDFGQAARNLGGALASPSRMRETQLAEVLGTANRSRVEPLMEFQKPVAMDGATHTTHPGVSMPRPGQGEGRGEQHARTSSSNRRRSKQE